MSYAGDFREGWRVAAVYVDKIFKGANPAITIPQSILVRADELIQ